MANLSIQSSTLEMLKFFENPREVGFKGNTVRAYWDSNGYAIGWGSRTLQNGSNVTSSTTLSRQQAEDLLKFHAQRAAAHVNAIITANINYNQWDSLVSLAYNVGTLGDTIRNTVNRTPNDFDAVQRAFLLYVNVRINGVLKRSEVLVDRRQQEALSYAQPTFPKNSSMWIIVVGILVYVFRKKLGINL